MRMDLIGSYRFLFGAARFLSDTGLLSSLSLKVIAVVFIDIKCLRINQTYFIFSIRFVNNNYLSFRRYVLSFDSLKRVKIFIEPLHESKMEMIEKLHILDLIPVHVLAMLILRESKAWLREVRTKIPLLLVQ